VDDDDSSPEALRAAYREGRVEKRLYTSRIHRRNRVLFDYARYLIDSDVEKIELQAGEVIVTSRSRQVRLVCDPDDEHLVPFTLLNFGAYEPNELDAVLRLVAPGGRVFDVGANVGFYAVVLAREIPRLDIHCFEPMEHTCANLERNLALNDVRNVRVHRLGFAESDGQRDFYYARACSGGTSLADLDQPGGVIPVAAQVRRLDSFCEEHDLWPDFVKCDVEGAELLVVKGALGAIRRARPILLLELLRKWSAPFGYHPNDVLDLLAEHGYRRFTAAPGGALREFDRVSEETVETNYFFLHSDAHGGLIEGLLAR
jgi:FkbM family methyltransferase